MRQVVYSEFLPFCSFFCFNKTPLIEPFFELGLFAFDWRRATKNIHNDGRLTVGFHYDMLDARSLQVVA